ncbi:hypothetical protein RB614_16430 [Phytohabitans sp. ZYX-F-186]|uniref:Uncharacterized protein n=1 Tax=Phytohabitans maris TaxID=3071409 RepID=A0ABU0ZI42_9ACTN|nr:hypothetical protein [Phytohabitans sp. ZYX-F-186]MDQ7906099.1 hypothetical protein [Phytohabitans sp. ZYX-F-186]
MTRGEWMGVHEDEPDDDGEVEAFPFRLGPPNRGRHRDPMPQAHGLGRHRTVTARHEGRGGNDRG